MLKFHFTKKSFVVVTVITLLFSLTFRSAFAADDGVKEQAKPEVSTATQSKNNILIDGPYVKFNPTGENAAAYLTIKNSNAKKVKLIEVQTNQPSLIKKIEIHDHVVTDKIAKMVHLKKGLNINPNSEVALKEGGKHIMLLGTNQELLEKAKDIELKLNFIIDGKNVEISENFQIKQDGKKECCCKHKQ